MGKVRVVIVVLGKMANSLEETLRKSIAMAGRLLEACAWWMVEKVKANLLRIIYGLITALIALLPPLMYLYLKDLLQRFAMPILISSAVVIVLSFSLRLPQSKRGEVLERSLYLLSCGFEKPFPVFTVVFLISVGLLFAIEEAGGESVRNFLDHVVFYIRENKVTCESIIVLLLAFLSSFIAAWHTPKVSRCYRDFTGLMASVIIRFFYVFIATPLWLLFMGLSSPELGMLKVLGLSVMLLWLEAWASLCLERWRRSPRSERELSRTSHR